MKCILNANRQIIKKLSKLVNHRIDQISTSTYSEELGRTRSLAFTVTMDGFQSTSSGHINIAWEPGPCFSYVSKRLFLFSSISFVLFRFFIASLAFQSSHDENILPFNKQVNKFLSQFSRKKAEKRKREAFNQKSWEKR